MSKPEKTFEESVYEVGKECNELLIDKQRDYGSGNILKFGEFGCLVRASDKLERLINLMDSGKEPQNESIEDTWKDLRNYAQIALMVRRGQFDLPLEDKDGSHADLQGVGGDPGHHVGSG